MTTTTLPTNIGYGRVVGQWLKAVGDGIDVDSTPDGVAATGKVTFTPSVARVANSAAVPNPVTIIPTPVVCQIDSSGYLIDPQGNKGVWLIATDDTDNNPSGWTYSVKLELTGLVPQTFSISVAEGATTDLSLAAPVVSSSGSGIVRGPSGPSAFDTALANGFVGTEAEWLGTLEGPKGDPGPGASDTDLAARANDPASQFRAALSATIAAEAVPKWKANTAYAAGTRVVNPSGDVVLAKVAFTSGASYDATKWNLPATYVTPAAADAKYASISRSSRIIALGDSTDDSSSSTGRWVFYYLSGSKRAQIIRNAGIGGNRSDQMLGRIQTDVIAYKPDIVMLGSNTNDLGNANIVSLDQSKANLQAMVAAVRAAGAVPVLRNTLPTDGAGNAAPYNTIALRRQGVLTYNTWLRAYAAAQGLDLLDVYQAVADPLTGGYKAGLTSDGIHPTDAGSKAIADYLLALPLPGSFKGGFNFARAVTDPTNMLVNGVFIGDANADGLADSWSNLLGAGTKTLTAAATGITGNWQRLTSADTSVVTIGVDITTGFATGDVLEIVCRVRTSGTSSALVRMTPYPFGSPGTGIDIVPNTTSPVDGIASGRFTTPSDVTKYRVSIQSSGAAGWIEVAEIALRNLTQLGLV